MIEQQITIGKSIIKKFFDYCGDESLDDETEFFPVLKIIIAGIVESLKKGSQKKVLKKELKEYSKQLYVSFWLFNTEEDEGDIDTECEKAEAICNFEKLYRITRKA